MHARARARTHTHTHISTRPPPTHLSPPKADVWALGITILECTDSAHPFFDTLPMSAMFNIVSGPPPALTRPQLWSQLFVDFLSKCLDKDASSRYTCSQLMDHPWMKSFSLFLPQPEEPKPPAGGVNALNVVKDLIASIPELRADLPTSASMDRLAQLCSQGAASLATPNPQV